MFDTKLLSELCVKITDGSHFSPKPQQEGELIANVKDMRDGYVDLETCTRISQADFNALRATGCVIQENDVLLSKDGTVGRVVVYRQSDEIGALSSICLIKTNRELSPRFLGQVLSSAVCKRQYENFMSGSALRRLVLRDIRKLSVPVPQKGDQEIIADILDTLDTQIRQTEAIIAKLQQVKQGLLHDLLTRGINSRGQLRPPREQASELYKESPLGWIPREWEVQSIEQLGAWVTSGSRDWAQFYSDQGDIFVRIGNLTREHINFRLENLQHVTPPKSADGQRTKLIAGDVLISITADLGIVGVIPEGFGDAYINQHIALVRFPAATMEPRFAGHFLGSEIFQRHVSQNNDAGAKAGLNLPTVRGFELVVPSLTEQKAIMERLDACDTKIAEEKILAKKFKVEKTGLMDDLLTGRVRVNELIECQQAS